MPNLSVNLMFLKSDMSAPKKLGPKNVLRPSFPVQPGHGRVKNVPVAEPGVPFPLRLKSAIGFGTLFHPNAHISCVVFTLLAAASGRSFLPLSKLKSQPVLTRTPPETLALPRLEHQGSQWAPVW